MQLNRKHGTAPGAACALCCAPFSPFNCKQHSRTQQRHCTRQRAAKQAAPRAAKKLARDSSTARGNALNHHTQQPRAQKNSSRSSSSTRQRAESHAAPRAEKNSRGSSALSSAPTHITLSQQFFAPPSPLVESVLRPCVHRVLVGAYAGRDVQGHLVPSVPRKSP